MLFSPFWDKALGIVPAAALLELFHTDPRLPLIVAFLALLC